MRASAIAVAEAARELRAGRLVIYPTDTVYGIAADATNRAAVRRVYAAKGRDFRKPLSIMFGSLAMAKRYLVVSARDEAYMRAHRGHYTFVIAKRPRKRIYNGADAEIGVRIASTQFDRKLILAAGVPITATSANHSGEPAATDALDAALRLAKRCSLAIDGGPARAAPSKVVDLRTGEVLR